MSAHRSASADRRARVEQMRKAEQARERRARVLTLSVSAAVVAGLVGFGAYVLNEESEERQREEAAAKAPVRDEKSWDAKELGRDHVTQAVAYPMKPPVGGDHHQAWMDCDGAVYKEPVPEVNAVHSLEHGAVWVTYNAKAPKDAVETLEKKVARTPYTMMSPVGEQSGAIMLTAWGKQVTVDGADDPRVNQFLAKYVQGPQTPEPGAACTGGLNGTAK
ncbi:DUF3105 domain-containing protein [Streptomyces fradiae]|uniref:DUF3105 domain-containing protein n=1 Tax=Streptomyces fradiae TaxID=1906 RepID=UPI0029420134|nr:DUF3105 domain-containing protein [Streptomyces fradiae]WOI59678.1 DUF3105 domain-containing protein [Streptomyces fradiae]